MGVLEEEAQMIATHVMVPPQSWLGKLRIRGEMRERKTIMQACLLSLLMRIQPYIEIWHLNNEAHDISKQPVYLQHTLYRGSSHPL
jgi:hypothetical protein